MVKVSRLTIVRRIPGRPEFVKLNAGTWQVPLLEEEGLEARGAS